MGGGGKLRFSAGNKPVKHITSSYIVSLWSYKVAQDVVMCFHWEHPVWKWNMNIVLKPLTGIDLIGGDSLGAMEKSLVAWLFMKEG